MPIRKRHFVAAAAVAAIAVPLAVAGAASATEDVQPPTQGVDAGLATLQNATESFLDAVNGQNRAPGADGTETEFPPVAPQLVDGPLSGLIQNGPFE